MADRPVKITFAQMRGGAANAWFAEHDPEGVAY
jgi:hypothetical protein